MNCCNHNNHNGHNNNNNNSGGQKHKGHLSHMWMMLLCCGLPIILLAVVSLLGTALPGVRNVLISILPFMCPLMMVAMIPMMLRKGKNNENDRSADHNDNNVAKLPDNRE